MTEQEEDFIHFSACITWLNKAWRLLLAIREQSDNPLIGPAFRFALIEYSKPYKLSCGTLKKRKLDTEFIPPNLLALHKQIVDSRDQVHAHSDLTLMEAKLSVHDYLGQRYTLIAQNYTTFKLDTKGGMFSGFLPFFIVIAYLSPLIVLIYRIVHEKVYYHN